MKILLLNPPFSNLIGVKGVGGHRAPLNLLYLASYLREKMNCDISMLDCELEGMDFDDIKKYFSKTDFDILAMTCPTAVYNHVVKIAKIAKELDQAVRTIIGGNHPSALPEVVTKESSIDFAVIGEGEITFYELCKAIHDRSGVGNIKGIAYKSKRTRPRGFIENLDALPFPARDMLDLQKHHPLATKSLSGQLKTSIVGSRGCAFNCTHCSSRCMWGRRVRVRSAKNIVDEIEECYSKYEIEEFKFDDDNVIIFKEWLMSLCDEIKKRNLDISWVCMSRADNISKEMAKSMRDAGCRRVSLGIESGNQRVLDLIRKNITLSAIKRGVRVFNEAGIEVHASFMFGNLGETERSIRDTINFAKSLDLEYASFFITIPYPGTDLYEIAKEKGNINKNTKWEQFDLFSDNAPLVQDDLTIAELKSWRNRAYREFYFRPIQILKKISEVRSWKQLKIIIEGAMIFLKIQKD